MRISFKAHYQNPNHLKQQLLAWAQQFDEVVWMDSNYIKTSEYGYDAVLAVDALTVIQNDGLNAFEQLREYQHVTNDWIFGYLSYDLKNDVEQLSSKNHDGLKFPELWFFQPKKLFLLSGTVMEVHYLNMVAEEWAQDKLDIDAYAETQRTHTSKDSSQNNVIEQRIPQEDYLQKVKSMLKHIHLGDIYEANFCMEFFAENTQIDPLAIYKKLNAISNPPFASYLKNYDKFAMSASPERYIKKEGSKVISQPIKGTARRSNDALEDANLKAQLSTDGKERSENIMIVDLVRNDLSKTAIKGSVKVKELCKIHSFKQVHQMISTVTSKVEATVNPVDIIKTTFPMGSMTGAPKISAMKIIEDLESTKRGLYSGAIGYFTPENDFDFSVVIRSILYNESEKYVSYSVGSAITAKSEPIKEYEECLVKAKAMREVLED